MSLFRPCKSVAPYDWNAYFRDRLTSTSAEAPVGGIEAGGWKVDYTDKPPEAHPGGRLAGSLDGLYSLGLRLAADGNVLESLVGSPAYVAGITQGMKVVAVNDRSYTPDLLNDALKSSPKIDQPTRLLVLNDDYYKTCTINYHRGVRYPHLVRVEGKADLLDEISRPLAAK